MAKIKIEDLDMGNELSANQAALVQGGMFPASTKGAGVSLSFPDVCKTPSPAGR